MSKRLQVVLDDSEYRDLRKLSQREGLSLSQWVRQALRTMRRLEPAHDSARKLEAVRAAARHQYPSGDIDQMLEEIESGYQVGAAGRRRVAEP